MLTWGRSCCASGLYARSCLRGQKSTSFCDTCPCTCRYAVGHRFDSLAVACCSQCNSEISGIADWVIRSLQVCGFVMIRSTTIETYSDVHKTRQFWRFASVCLKCHSWLSTDLPLKIQSIAVSSVFEYSMVDWWRRRRDLDCNTCTNHGDYRRKSIWVDASYPWPTAWQIASIGFESTTPDRHRDIVSDNIRRDFLFVPSLSAFCKRAFDCSVGCRLSCHWFCAPNRANYCLWRTVDDWPLPLLSGQGFQGSHPARSEICSSILLLHLIDYNSVDMDH